MVVIVVLLIILIPFAYNISYEYGAGSNVTNSFQALNSTLNKNFTQNVLKPLIGNPQSGINTSSTAYHGLNYTLNPYQSSQLLGFSFAFLVPQTINIMLELINLPSMIGNFIATGLSILPLPLTQIQRAFLGNEVTALGWTFIALLFVSVVSKYPIWQG